jgi:hypothetical protein
MLYAPLGYKIMFYFDMPDGKKNGGISNNPEGLGKIFDIVAMMDGSNLVIEDRTIYKEIDELREETQTPEWKTEEEL